MSCAHTAEFDDPRWTEPAPDATDGCQDCVALGENVWAHLRMCLTCGHVGLLRLQPAPARHRPPPRRPGTR